MTLKELATGKRVPHWVSAAATVIALASGGLAVWSQVEQTFPALFDEGASYYEEYAKHFDEESVEQTFTDDRIGTIGVAWYPSDGCLLITTPGRQPHWLTRSSLTAIENDTSRATSPLLAGLAFNEPPCVTEGCRDPHAGTFGTRYGEPRDERGGSWTPVYRSFNDGCEHYQLRRSDGVWDVDQEGAPRVCWTRCIHVP